MKYLLSLKSQYISECENDYQRILQLVVIPIIRQIQLRPNAEDFLIVADQTAIILHILVLDRHANI